MSILDRPFRDPQPEIIETGDARLTAIKRALVVVAHPDDLEGHCGGTAGLLTRSGCAMHLLVCSSGEKGTADRAMSPVQLGRVRESEQLAAARRLGITSVTFFRYPDGEVPSDREIREQIVRSVRRYTPDLVITHDPEFPWPAHTAHRDHRAVGRATLDALYPDARDHLFFPEQIRDEGLAPHRTPEAWLIMSRIPDLYVNIETTIDLKIAARLEHASQFVDPEALDRSFRVRATEIGASLGINFAEAFKIVRFV